MNTLNVLLMNNKRYICLFAYIYQNPIFVVLSLASISVIYKFVQQTINENWRL